MRIRRLKELTMLANRLTPHSYFSLDLESFHSRLRLQNKDHHEAGRDMNYKGEFLDDTFVEGSHRFLINDEDSPSERTHNVSQ
jgi:hypothetical protein